LNKYPPKTFFRKIYGLLKGFLNRLNEDHISAFSAQGSYFFILAFFPFLMLMLTLIQYTPITEDVLIDIVVSFLPEGFHSTASGIINELYSKSGTALISITAIALLWSASKGILALIRGFNCIYQIDEKRNYFILRFISVLYTIAFIVGIVITLAILVFGNSLLKLIDLHFPIIYNIVEWIISLRGLYIPIFLSLIFVILYKLVPNKNFRFVDHLPGAIFSALGWEVFSFAYSIYIDYYANYSYIYGSLTSIILLLLWLYFCMYILFLGAEINVYFRRHFQMAHNFVKQHRDESKNEDLV